MANIVDDNVDEIIGIFRSLRSSFLTKFCDNITHVMLIQPSISSVSGSNLGLPRRDEEAEATDRPTA